jgi:hypothetical protein
VLTKFRNRKGLHPTDPHGRASNEVNTYSPGFICAKFLTASYLDRLQVLATNLVTNKLHNTSDNTAESKIDPVLIHPYFSLVYNP